jgi:hypothetical protein
LPSALPDKPWQDAEKVRQRQKTVIWFIWFVSFVWLNETYQMNQINQINKTNRSTRRATLDEDGHFEHPAGVFSCYPRHADQ